MAKTIIYSDPFIPAEWIAAHGLRPMRIIPHAVKEALSLNVAAGVCPYALAFAHHIITDAAADAALMTTTCDQMRRLADVVGMNCTLPLFLMDIPSTWQTPTAQKMYISELRRLGRFLVELGGKSPDNEALAEVMRGFDDARTALRAARGRLSSRAFSEAIAHFHHDAEISLDELEAERTQVNPAKGARLALIGGPLMQDDFFVFDLIGALGGCVVLDGTETGERTMAGPYDRRRLKEDPFMALSERYFGEIPDVFRRPNSEFYKWLRKELEERDVQGIIVRRYLWCDLWHAEVERLREWANLPLLDMDTVGDKAAESRLAERVQSLLEAMQ
jgi:benzoyl-CoA reductase/2-hydroxyglutaryl-CoA dehydratase subunit BcrC/BadD/HgdB